MTLLAKPVVWACCISIALAFTSPTKAAEIDLVYPDGTPFSEVLSGLSRSLGIPICCDPVAGSIKMKVQLRSVEPLDGLFVLAKMAQCRVKSMSNERGRYYDVIFDERGPSGCGSYTASRRPNWLKVKQIREFFGSGSTQFLITTDEETNVVLISARTETLIRLMLRQIDLLEKAARTAGASAIPSAVRSATSDPLAAPDLDLGL